MDHNIILIIVAVISLLVGGIVTSTLLKNSVLRKSKGLLQEARDKSEVIKKEKILQAKEKFLQLKSEHEKIINEKNQQVLKNENRIRQKESTLSKKIEETNRNQQKIDSLKGNLDNQLQILEAKQTEIDKMHKDQVNQLETISGYSAEQAKSKLIESLKGEAESEAMVQIREIADEARLTANREAKKIVIETIQRTAAEHAIENTVTVFNIESDEIKGRIIGREGRNIRALEAMTGIEIIIDDSPDAILLSGFDPIRREIASLALKKLVTDGRIHPARIEEVVAKTRAEVEEEILEVGKRTVIDLGVHNMHHELIKLVGRMKYRSSYGQNLLAHSREVANLSATMASELGLNPKKSKTCWIIA